ncbi:MAG: S1 RNA-binding domain-containing protein [Oscillospiraceae bacterium]|nr:S1 RNA-binding domain-containing protein [Oscillospiraceae bacterium]
MELKPGMIVEGKVKSITNFGAFVALEDGASGLVHISEVANAYVSDVHQFLTVGQDVRVLVLSVEDGKINLSVKKAQPKPERRSAPAEPGSQSFDDMLKRFLADSDSKIAGSKQYDHRTKTRRR